MRPRPHQVISNVAAAILFNAVALEIQAAPSSPIPQDEAKKVGGAVTSDGTVSIKTVCRGPVRHFRPVFKDELKKRSAGQLYEFRVGYTATVTTELCEDGNCGAFTCNLSCTLSSSNPSFDRTLEYKKNGQWVAVGTKQWVLRKPTTQSYSKNCNEVQNNNLPDFVNGYLGTATDYSGQIKDDTVEINKIIDSIAP